MGTFTHGQWNSEFVLLEGSLTLDKLFGSAALFPETTPVRVLAQTYINQ